MAFLDFGKLATAIIDITQSGGGGSYNYEAVIVIGTFRIQVLKVSAIDENWDFENAFAGETVLSVTTSLAEYVSWIYPHRTNLTVEVTRAFIEPRSLTPRIDSGRQTQYYDATLNKAVNPSMLYRRSQDPSQSMYDFELSLRDPAIEQIMLSTTGGVFIDCTPHSVLATLLMQKSRTLRLSAETEIKGLSTIPPNNDVVRKHVTVPHGTELMNLPVYLQEHQGGIYNHGIGLYLHRQYWYLYAPYDVGRYTEEKYTLDIFNVPSSMMPDLNVTYRVIDGKLQVLCTGEVNHLDTSEIVNLTAGNGVRSAQASKVLDEFVEVKGNSIKASRSKTINEYLVNSRARLQVAYFSDDRISENRATEVSALSKRGGEIINCIWENANPSLLRPGMPVRFHYMENDQLVTKTGTVLGASNNTFPERPSLTVLRYQTTCSLILFVK